MVGCIAFGSPDVAHQSFVFGSFYSTAFEQAAVVVGSEVAPVIFVHGHEFVAGLKLGSCGRWGVAVVGTNGLTTVAAIDIVAHGRGNVGRYLASVLYCLV